MNPTVSPAPTISFSPTIAASAFPTYMPTVDPGPSDTPSNKPSFILLRNSSLLPSKVTSSTVGGLVEVSPRQILYSYCISAAALILVAI
mmetsp:Transcript_1212/g.1752  ORF Transcript_1212/g.1752 Transcript_1212/m.1752 type:complete len:89 (-) Transcript_1212:320-586(-)